MTATAQRGSLKKIRDDVQFHKHQLDGIRWLARRSSSLLLDEMGLGKSLQCLVVAAIAFEQGTLTRFLVVCPTTLKPNWQDEMEKFTSFTCVVLEGTPKQRSAQLAEFDADALVVNYEQVIPHLDELNAMGFGLVIYDEAHYIKSRKSKRTKAALALAAPRHIPVTGSPLLNQVDDLWALLHRVDPKRFPDYWRFVNRYAVFGGYKDKQIIGIKNERELREILAEYSIRREKKDTLDLPDKQHIVIKLELSPEQKKLYKEATEELKISSPTSPTPFEIENALTKFLRLKQICGTTASIPGHPDHSTKLDRAVEMIEEIIANGEPVVVFTQFLSVLSCLAERLERVGVEYRMLRGDVPVAERQPIVRQWTEAAGKGRPQALICMLQVAGIGLTMTAASKCIFLDKLFVPKLNEQAEDRLHRIGADKTKPVQIFELQMRNTIEQRIESIIRRKQSIFGAVVANDNSDWKKRLIAAVLEDDDVEA